MNLSHLPIHRTRIWIALFLLLLVSCAIFFSRSSITYANSYIVTTTSDTVDANIGDGICADSDGECSLRAAIQEANQGGEDLISLPSGTYTLTRTGTGEDASATGDLDLTDSDLTTITGADEATTIIDGNDIDRVISFLSNSEASLSNLTIQNGTSPGSSVGGGAYMYTSTVTFDSVTVQNNVVSSPDPEFGTQGGGIFCSGTDLTVTNSTITGNGTSSNPYHGAGIYIGESCITDFDTVTISENLSNDWGAGMYVVNHSTTEKTFSDVTIANNSGGTGAGIYVAGGTGYEDVVFTNSTISGNTSVNNGAGGYIIGPAHFTNVTVSGNEADGRGGGFRISNHAYVDVTFAFSTIVGNTADADNDNASDVGGGLNIDGSSADVILTGTLLAGNTSNGNVGPDCYADAGLNPGKYNLLGDSSACTASWDGTNIINPIDQDFITSPTLMDNGGNIETLSITDTSTDVVPEAFCLDAEGSALDRDARGVDRPENITCNIGAYELDETDPTVTANSGIDIVECSTDTWLDSGASVTDNSTASLTASTLDTVTEETVGEYSISYASEGDYDGNTGTATRTVTVQDTLNPSISLVGSASLTIEEGTAYTDAGATATDTCDSSVMITTNNPVDTDTPSTYTVTYTATDDSGNEATASRTVVVTASESDSEEDTEENSEEDSSEEDDGTEEESDQNDSEDEESSSDSDIGEDTTEDSTDATTDQAEQSETPSTTPSIGGGTSSSQSASSSTSTETPEGKEKEKSSEDLLDTDPLPSVYRVRISLKQGDEPLAGVKVELHSEPQTRISDASGEVFFTDVEAGEHTLIVYHNGDTHERSLTVSGDSETIDVAITIEATPERSWWTWLFLSISILLLIILTILIGHRRNTPSSARSNNV